jgi:hypothetical protein
MSTPYTEAELETAAEAVCPSPQNHYDGESHERDCTPIALAVLDAVAGSIAARAWGDCVEALAWCLVNGPANDAPECLVANNPYRDRSDR